MILFKNAALRRGPRALFSQVTLTIHNGEKVGLVGDNGSGKSSLLALIRNELMADEGEIEINAKMRIAHVAQETPHSEDSAIDYVIDGDTKYRETERKLANIDHVANPVESAQLLAQMEAMDGYSIHARAAKIMNGLGFNENQLNLATHSFSGGWRVRLNLAQALIAPSDILLLDEPTNHLDIDAIVWLENWLKRYEGTIILISHDREFIDQVCRRILHIDRTTLVSYKGNYSQFERIRAEVMANEQALYEKQQRQIAHMEKYIDRFRAQATKAKQAQSRIKALERMQLINPAHVNSPFKFRFFEGHRINDPILKLQNIDAGYDDHVVLQSVSLSISSKDRIGLLGRNGAGKSTLIKVLANELSLFDGERSETKHLNIGYFAQHQLEQLEPSYTPLKQIQVRYPNSTTQELRSYLGGFGFQGDHIDQPIGQFSGGEKSRLALALLIYKKPNLLLLDEPTNHLDIEIRHALTLAIQQYEGAIILVSHDRHLLNTVTDQLLLVHENNVTPFSGDMADYIKWAREHRNDHAIRSASQTGTGVLDSMSHPESSSSKPSKTEGESGASKKARRQIQAQQRAKVKPLSNKIKTFERQMSQIEVRLKEIETTLLDPGYFETAEVTSITQLSKEQSVLGQQLTELELQWYEASEALESALSEYKEPH